jgi:serine protease Do
MSASGKLILGLVALVVIALVVGGLFRAGYVHFDGRTVFGAERVNVEVASNAPAVSLASFQNGFSSVVDGALSSVVNISSTKLVKQPQNVPGFFNDPFFRQFFGDQFGPQQNATPQTEREYSLGSGVIVNPDGYILTNNHVIAGASDVEVSTRDQHQYKAKVIGADPQTDVAVLKIDASGMPAFTLADSSKLKVGDVVFAIGDPFGIGETATMGIVSATQRALGSRIEHYEDFIQTDAAINPGNSGGALIDLSGHLTGINTAILTGQGGGGGNEGVGFAIPINLAHEVMDQIVQHGKVVRGYMGITVQQVDPNMAKAFGLSHGGGALIGDVTPNGPAAKAGLQRGDIVTQINGKDVTGMDDLSLRISELAPGTVAHLTVVRNGQTMNIDVTLAEYPEQNGAANTLQGAPGQPTSLRGMQVQNMTPDLAQQIGVPSSTPGVVVTQVDPSSSAAAAGIQAGDIIQEVNHKPVRNMEDYQAAVRGVADQPILLLINHQGATHFAVLEPQ